MTSTDIKAQNVPENIIPISVILLFFNTTPTSMNVPINVHDTTQNQIGITSKKGKNDWSFLDKNGTTRTKAHKYIEPIKITSDISRFSSFLVISSPPFKTK